MPRKYFILPAKITKVEHQDPGQDKILIDSVEPEGIPLGVNYGVFYDKSPAKLDAITIVVVELKDFTSLSEINGSVELTKAEAKEIKISYDYNIETLDKRLSSGT
jgi:hypothetical protein